MYLIFLNIMYFVSGDQIDYILYTLSTLQVADNSYNVWKNAFYLYLSYSPNMIRRLNIITFSGDKHIENIILSPEFGTLLQYYIRERERIHPKTTFCVIFLRILKTHAWILL